MVLLIDERPEEVTDMRSGQSSATGEVDRLDLRRPSDEHTQVAEMVDREGPRMVEFGETS